MEEKCKYYGHTPILKALATVLVRVPVTEPGTGLGTGDRAWYRYRISLVVPVPVRNSVPIGPSAQMGL